MAEQISDRTTISLSISSWWHVVVILGVIITCYFGLEAKADQAVKLSEATATEQKSITDRVNAMQMDIRSVADDVKWFRQQYEHDMSKYIRETPTK